MKMLKTYKNFRAKHKINILNYIISLFNLLQIHKFALMI